MSGKNRSAQLPVHDKNTLPPQEVIDLFKTAFNDELYLEEDKEKLHGEIQGVKGDLYNRDYAAAFGDEVKRIAYCCRWSPSRATAYGSLFAHFPEITDVFTCAESDQSVLCIGGGAGSELIAMASIFAPTRTFTSKYSKDLTAEGNQEKSTLTINLVDIADWSNVLKKLTDQIEDRWLYGGEMKYFDIKFNHKSILQMDASEMVLSKLNLITLLFTTNELFTEHKAESIRLLQKFNQNCNSGCHLLIVESAGSYSHITIGTKKFPIHFLIDTILVGKKGTKTVQEGSWTLVDENDSIWYRGDTKLDYPMKLENMRFFYRLYRKN